MKRILISAAFLALCGCAGPLKVFDPVVKAGIPWRADYIEINVSMSGSGNAKIYGFSSLGRGMTNWPPSATNLPAVK